MPKKPYLPPDILKTLAERGISETDYFRAKGILVKDLHKDLLEREALSPKKVWKGTMQ